jgi:hypothetical protein
MRPETALVGLPRLCERLEEPRPPAGLLLFPG